MDIGTHSICGILEQEKKPVVTSKTGAVTNLTWATENFLGYKHCILIRGMATQISTSVIAFSEVILNLPTVQTFNTIPHVLMIPNHKIFVATSYLILLLL